MRGWWVRGGDMGEVWGRANMRRECNDTHM